MAILDAGGVEALARAELEAKSLSKKVTRLAESMRGDARGSDYSARIRLYELELLGRAYRAIGEGTPSGDERAIRALKACIQAVSVQADLDGIPRGKVAKEDTAKSEKARAAIAQVVREFPELGRALERAARGESPGSRPAIESRPAATTERVSEGDGQGSTLDVSERRGTNGPED